MAISKYSNPLGQTLEQYIPLPFEEMSKAGSAIQQRGDLAEQQRDQVETGLSSMETMASGQTQFKNNFVNDYKKEGMELLKKYPNPSDPDFIRESRKLNMKYAADPRLQTIKQTNEFLKNQEKYKQEAAFKGIKVIDPNKNFTGVDSNGNLIVPKNSARGTNFDEDLTKSFLQIKDNMIDNGRGWKSNKQNLDQLAGNLVKNLETNPVTRDAIDYYTQQGMTPEQARQATKGLIQQAYTDNLKTDRDYSYDQLQLAYARDARERAKTVPLVKSATLLDDKTPVTEQANPFKLKVQTIDKVLTKLNQGGGITKNTFVVEDTPENREKYKGKFTQQVSTIAGSGLGYGGSSYRELKVKDSYDKDQLALVREAREALGEAAKHNGNYLSDKNVLTKYKEALNNSAKDFRPQLTYDKKLNNIMQDIFVGNSGERADQLYTIKNGGLVEVDRTDLKNFRYQGITTSPTDLLPDGFMKVTATDKSGAIKTFAMPIPDDVKNKTVASSTLYNYINTGKIDYSKVRAPLDSKGNPIEGHFVDPNTGYIYKPYKRYENGKFGVGATIYNGKTGKIIGQAPLSTIEKQDLTNFYDFVGSQNE